MIFRDTMNNGIIKVFLSSTFRDLENERAQILDKLNNVLLPIGMEYFIPNGKESQEIALFDEKRGLINSDIVIFLISPRYGSIIEECKLKDRCNADCPMKCGSLNSISYTHCEYKFAKAENKQCLTFLYNSQGWELVTSLNQMQELNWEKIFDDIKFKGFSADEIKSLNIHKKLSLQFRNEIKEEFVPTIDFHQLSIILSNLTELIVKWYSEGTINFNNFCGRRKQLLELIEKLDNNNVEVYGIGGIGKTTFIQIVLLLQKLNGNQILSIGKKQSYLSGSGYQDFKERCRENIFEITTDIITINDVLEALRLNAALKIEDIDEKIQHIINKVHEENYLIFIDDFQIADDDVKKLIRCSLKGFIIASKSNSGITKKEIHIKGIESDEREKLIDIISENFDKQISLNSKEKIKIISEGHPITIELFVRNFDKLDLKKYEDLRTDLFDQSNPQLVDEFINRVIIDILSPDALKLIKILSIINTDIENNIHKETLIKTIKISSPSEIFNELINTGLIKKKEEKEGIYQFSFKHIQEAIRETNKEYHHIVINYYKNKLHWVAKKADDEVEILHHSRICNPSTDYATLFLNISNVIEPIDYNFRRFIEFGEEIKSDTTLENKKKILLHLGIKYQILNRFKESKQSLNSYIFLITKLYSRNKKKYQEAKLNALINLGNLYDKINKYREAEASHLQALEICEERLARSNNINPKIQLAIILQNLGNTQINLKHFDAAEKSYNRSLNLWYEIAKKQKITCSEKIATGLNNLAGLYLQIGKYPEADIKLKESIDILSKLMEKNPGKYEPEYIMYLANLGLICLSLNNYLEAEKILLESYNRLEFFFKINPDAFCRDIVSILESLITLYQTTSRIREAEHYAKESEKYLEFLVKQCSYAYLPIQASNYTTLGDICCNLNKPAESLEYLRKSQNILNKLYEKTPDYYITDQLYLKNVKGGIFLKIHNYQETKREWCQVLEILRNLIKEDENAYIIHLNAALINLGHLLYLHNEFDISQKFFNECLINRRKLVYQCKDAHLDDLIHILNSLGNLYVKMKVKAEPEILFSEAINIYEVLIPSKKEIFQKNYAETLQNFGNYYISINKPIEAKIKLDEAYKIRKQRCILDNDLYLDELVETLLKLAELFILDKKYEEAEKCLCESKKHCEYLLTINSEIFTPLYANTLRILGKSLILYSKMEDAELYLKKAIYLINFYFEMNPLVFGNSLLESYQELKGLYLIRNEDKLIHEIDANIKDINEKIRLFVVSSG